MLNFSVQQNFFQTWKEENHSHFVSPLTLRSGSWIVPIILDVLKSTCDCMVAVIFDDHVHIYNGDAVQVTVYNCFI